MTESANRHAVTQPGIDIRISKPSCNNLAWHRYPDQQALMQSPCLATMAGSASRQAFTLLNQCHRISKP